MANAFLAGQFETRSWHSRCCFFEVMKRLLSALCGVLVFGLMGQSHATVIFSDNFNTENGGIGQLNYKAFANWTVSDGTVDLIGNGFFDFFPGNGLYVDLDGTSFQAGTFTSIGIPVTPGIYFLSFLLAGSQRGDVNTVEVNVSGGLAGATYTLASNVPLTLEIMSFTVLAPTTINFSFHNEGGDNIGLILDNVDPQPPPLWGARFGINHRFFGDWDVRIGPDGTKVYAPCVIFHIATISPRLVQVASGDFSLAFQAALREDELCYVPFSRSH
jgi:hypothetical protein